MKISQTHDRIIRLILTILSLVSSLDLMYILKSMIAHNKQVGDPARPYLVVIVYSILFIILAISYWIKNVPHLREVRNVIIIICLGLTISSYMIAWPAFILMPSTLMTMFNELLLTGTTLAALVANNLASFTSSGMVLLLFLKLISTGISLFYGGFVLINLAAGSNALMGTQAQNMIIAVAFVLALWNVAYAVVIWLKIYRQWWAWLLTVILILEVSVALIWEAAVLPSGSVWSSLIIAIIVAMITLIMTYFNNFFQKSTLKMD